MKNMLGVLVLISFSALAQNEAKMKASANGGKLSEEKLWEVSLLQNQIQLVKQSKPGVGFPGGYAIGGYGGGYQPSSLWGCNLSHDENEINCPNGKKYKISLDGDESERSEQYKQQWVPSNFNFGPSYKMEATGQ